MGAGASNSNHTVDITSSPGGRRGTAANASPSTPIRAMTSFTVGGDSAGSPSPFLSDANADAVWESSIDGVEWNTVPRDVQDTLEDGRADHKAQVQVVISRHLFTASLLEEPMVLKSAGGTRQLRRKLVPKARSGAADDLATSCKDSAVFASPQASRYTANLEATVKAHNAIAYCANFSVDGQRVLTGGRDGSVKLWEIDTSYVVREFGDHGGVVLSCQLNPAGTMALTGCDSTFAHLCDVKTGAMQRLEGHEHKVYSVGFTCDAKHCVTGSMDATVRYWDVERGVNLRKLAPHAQPIFTARCSPYSPHGVLTGGDDHKMVRLDLRQGDGAAQVFTGHDTTLWSVDWRFDEGLLVSGGMDGRALLWDPRNTKGPLRAVAKHGHAEVHHTEFMPEGDRLLTSARDGTWQMWRVRESPADIAEKIPSEDRLARCTAHDGVVFCVTYNATREQVLSCGSDSIVRLWSLVGQENAPPLPVGAPRAAAE